MYTMQEAVVADLFDERDSTRDATLQRTIDKIRDKSGCNAILLATQLPFLSRSTETFPPIHRELIPFHRYLQGPSRANL